MNKQSLNTDIQYVFLRITSSHLFIMKCEFKLHENLAFHCWNCTVLCSTSQVIQAVQLTQQTTLKAVCSRNCSTAINIGLATALTALKHQTNHHIIKKCKK